MKVKRDNGSKNALGKTKRNFFFLEHKLRLLSSEAKRLHF